MPTAQSLYARWITELWNGQPIASEIVTDDFVGHWPAREIRGPDGLAQIIQRTRNMFSDLIFAVEVGPLSEGDLVAGRWAGTGRGPDGPVSFTGNDILRLAADGQRFAEYWTGSSAG